MINYIPTTQSGQNLPNVLKSLSGQPWHTSSMLTAPPPKYNDHSSDNTSNSNPSKNLNNQSTPGSGSPDTTPTGFAPTDTELSGGITGIGSSFPSNTPAGFAPTDAEMSGGITGLGLDAGAGLDTGAGMGADALGAGGAMDFGWLAALFA